MSGTDRGRRRKYELHDRRTADDSAGDVDLRTVSRIPACAVVGRRQTDARYQSSVQRRLQIGRRERIIKSRINSKPIGLTVMVAPNTEREQAIAAIEAHLATHGPGAWGPVQAKFPNLPAPTFRRYVKAAREKAASPAILDAARAELAARAAATTHGDKVEAIADSLPVAPPPAFLAKNGDQGRVQLNLFGKIEQLFADANLLREFSLICLLVRLIMPWRLFAWLPRTLPVPVREKRFLAPLLVLSLGIFCFLAKRLKLRGELGMPSDEPARPVEAEGYSGG